MSLRNHWITPLAEGAAFYAVSFGALAIWAHFCEAHKHPRSSA
jgi:hypothetical protein